MKNTHKVLSDLSVHIVMDRVEAIALTYVLKDDCVVSHYDFTASWYKTYVKGRSNG